VYQEVSSFEQRLAELQSQLDRLTVSLQLWREQQDHLKPAEERLAELTRQCTDIITQWSVTGDRQARAVSQLEERVSAFSAAEERLHHDAATRMRTLERAIEQEWTALRQLHQGPVAELKEHASTLGQLSVAAANTSLSSIERTEARLAEIERTLNERLSGVSRQLEAAVAEIRAIVPARQGAEAAGPTWPIEGVVRLHNQLRSGPDGPGVITVPGGSTVPTGGPRGLPAAGPDILARTSVVESEPREVREEAATRAAAPRGRQTTLLAAVVASIVVLLAAVSAIAVQRQARAAAAQAATAQQQAQAAMAAATSQVTAARDQAAREVAQAREGSVRAQMVSDVLASPDLIRFNIAGSGPGAITGQVLWSRSRGVVFSALRVPPAPARMTYQLWLLTDAAPVTAGTFTPDEAGRVTFSSPPPRVPRAVTGAALTLEPAGGSSVPSDRLLGQNRAFRPAPAPAAAAAAAAPVAPQ
jgi:DNA repair exonuclease SbcCD ATPase subunit